MEKGYLTIDIPRNCSDCILCYDQYCCMVTGDRIRSINEDGFKDRIETCPLKTIDELKEEINESNKRNGRKTARTNRSRSV